MIRIQGTIPRRVFLACSGGVDSMAAADFLRRNHDLELIFFDHGTETSHKARDFLESYAKNEELVLHVGNITREKHQRESQEEYWRNERYKYLHSFSENQVITCHHLDDCVETWLFSSLNGNGKLLPYSNQNVFRPFRLNRKRVFEEWCRDKNVPWIEDESNSNTSYMRNYIRHELMPRALHVNPGLHKVVMKKIEKDK